MSNYGYVSDDVRTAVREAAERIGYRANTVARSMRAGTTKTLGFIGADIENPFFSAVMRGITDVAHEAGYETILFNSYESGDRERAAIRVLEEKRIDGIIVAPASVVDVDHLVAIQRQGIPLVVVDRAIPSLTCDSVVANNVGAAQAAASHLLGLGHRRIGLLASSSSVDLFQGFSRGRNGKLRTKGPARPVTERIRGYLTALDSFGVDHDLDLLRWFRPGFGEDPEHLVHAMLDLPEPPTAFMATDDAATKVLFRALKLRRVRIPRQVSLMGFDDLEWTQMVTPELCVVTQPAYEIGEEAARLLFDRIADPGAESRQSVLDTTIIRRASCAPAPA
jgi:LacI family transcriptional regulator